ncbi:hypothetical protein P692DRAFT_20747396, partial [Suillus brevipes Sb2]
LQLPCGHGSCQCHFKTHAGRTKHRNSAHPVIPNPMADVAEDLTLEHDVAPTGQEFDFQEPEHQELAHIENETCRMLPPDIDTEFWGLGDHLYRNLHKVLDGNAMLYLIIYLLT